MQPASVVTVADPAIVAGTANQIRVMNSGIQAVGTTQLAYTGVGIWPVYLAILVIFGGLMLIRLRKVGVQS